MLRRSIFLLAFVFSGVASGDGPASGPATKESSPSDDHLSVTHHEIVLANQTLKYEATAGTMLMRDDAGKSRARFFFVAYRQELAGGAKAATDRPITFVFNGGPGAAAVWLHLGAIGPQRIDFDDFGHAPAAPYKLQPNPQTWLDQTDLVFIDPVGTGFSGAAEGVKAEEFYGVSNDISSVAEFIRLYLTRYQRWGSPKFLAGESYGTTRAAGLSEYLLDRHGIALGGIIFMSNVLDFRTIQVERGNDLPYAMYLPSYSATAFFHNKLAADLQKELPPLLDEVQKFCLSTYLPALARGADLPADQRADLVQKLARYTGLPADFVEKSNLRISPDAFRKQLLNDQRLIPGRFDSRLLGHDPNPASGYTAFDPSFNEYFAAYTACFNQYVRADLDYRSDLNYEVLSPRVQPWDFDQGGRGYLDVSAALASAMRKNPRMKVLFASGRFDLATPYFATDYTISHMDLSPELRKNILRTFYDSGHMMYHAKTGLEKLKADVAPMFRASATQPAK